MCDYQFISNAIETAKSLENEILDIPNSMIQTYFLKNEGKANAGGHHFMSKKSSMSHANSNMGIEKTISSQTTS